MNKLARPKLRKMLLKAWSLVVFLLIMLLLNVLAAALPEPHFSGVVQFLNTNLLLLILLNLLFLFGDMFSALEFPLDLPAPIFNAVGGIFVVTFLIKVSELLQDLTEGTVVINLKPISTLLGLLVFLIILLAGYLSIFIKATSKRDDGEDLPSRRTRTRKKK